MTGQHSLVRTVTWAVGALVLLAGVALAEPGAGIPSSIVVLTTDQLKAMLDNKEPVLLVDARNQHEYHAGHIPKAIHVYDAAMEAHRALFPGDFSHPLVFYCNGYPKCGRSLNGAKTAVAWGYTQVYLYVAGFPAWEKQGYPVERE